VSQHSSSGVLKTVPTASGTVFNTPDYGCCDTRNMYTVNKYLHTVASVGFLFTFNIEYLWKKITADRLIYVLFKETVSHSEFIVSRGRNFSKRRIEKVCQ